MNIATLRKLSIENPNADLGIAGKQQIEEHGRGVAQKALFPWRTEEPDPNDPICVVPSPRASEEPSSI